jgi:hypothetical protein
MSDPVTREVGDTERADEYQAVRTPPAGDLPLDGDPNAILSVHREQPEPDPEVDLAAHTVRLYS